MGELINKLYQRKNELNVKNLNEESTTWLVKNLKKPDGNVFKIVNPKDIQPGKTYFLFYDLAAALKSSKMEQYSPIFVIKTSLVDNIPIMWGLNFNFMPERARIMWFDKILDRFFKGVINTNEEVKVKDKRLDVTFEGVYRTLASIGFEYSIREYRMDLIQKAYEINLNELDKFVSIDTSYFSGVDQKKLIEIWLSKLDKQEERYNKIRKELIMNFKIMNDNLEHSLDELEKAKEFLSKK